MSPRKGSGTGYPIALKCAKCRTNIIRRFEHAMSGGPSKLVATGRVTEITLPHGPRQTNRRIEYKCLTCGHVGWTQHVDAERLYSLYLVKKAEEEVNGKKES